MTPRPFPQHNPPLPTGGLNPIPPGGPLSHSSLVSACASGCSQILYLGSAPGLSTAVVQLNAQIAADAAGTGIRPLTIALGVGFSFMEIYTLEPNGVVFIK